MTELERIVEFDPAFDRREPGPHDQGVHGVEMRFVLKGEAGAITFVVFTNWMLPHVQQEQGQKIRVSETYTKLFIDPPQPLAIVYHSPTPRRENDVIIEDHCRYLNDKPCYSEVIPNGWRQMETAAELWNILLIDGSEGVWRELERYYHDLLET